MQAVGVPPGGSAAVLLPSAAPPTEAPADQLLVDVEYCGVAADDFGKAAPGTTVVGTVAGVGGNARGFAVGDAVVGVRAAGDGGGGLAERAAVYAHCAVKCGSTIAAADAAWTGALASHYILYTLALRAKPGETVFIPASPEQWLAVHVASALGLQVLTPTPAAADSRAAPTPPNVTHISRAGGGSGGDDAAAAAMRGAIFTSTSGRGVDYALVYDAAAACAAARCVAPNGRAVMMAPYCATPSNVDTVNLVRILAAKAAALHHHSLDAHLAAPVDESDLAHVLQDTVRLIAAYGVGCGDAPQLSSPMDAVGALNAGPRKPFVVRSSPRGGGGARILPLEPEPIEYQMSDPAEELAKADLPPRKPPPNPTKGAGKKAPPPNPTGKKSPPPNPTGPGRAPPPNPTGGKGSKGPPPHPTGKIYKNATGDDPEKRPVEKDGDKDEKEKDNDTKDEGDAAADSKEKTTDAEEGGASGVTDEESPAQEGGAGEKEGGDTGDADADADADAKDKKNPAGDDATGDDDGTDPEKKEAKVYKSRSGDDAAAAKPPPNPTGKSAPPPPNPTGKIYKNGTNDDPEKRPAEKAGDDDKGEKDAEDGKEGGSGEKDDTPGDGGAKAEAEGGGDGEGKEKEGDADAEAKSKDGDGPAAGDADVEKDDGGDKEEKAEGEGGNGEAPDKEEVADGDGAEKKEGDDSDEKKESAADEDAGDDAEAKAEATAAAKKAAEEAAARDEAAAKVDCLVSAAVVLAAAAPLELVGHRAALAAERAAFEAEMETARKALAEDKRAAEDALAAAREEAHSSLDKELISKREATQADEAALTAQLRTLEEEKRTFREKLEDEACTTRKLLNEDRERLNADRDRMEKLEAEYKMQKTSMELDMKTLEADLFKKSNETLQRIEQQRQDVQFQCDKLALDRQRLEEETVSRYQQMAHENETKRMEEKAWEQLWRERKRHEDTNEELRKEIAYYRERHEQLAKDAATNRQAQIYKAQEERRKHLQQEIERLERTIRDTDAHNAQRVADLAGGALADATSPTLMVGGGVGGGMGSRRASLAPASRARSRSATPPAAAASTGIAVPPAAAVGGGDPDYTRVASSVSPGAAGAAGAEPKEWAHTAFSPHRSTHSSAAGEALAARVHELSAKFHGHSMRREPIDRDIHATPPSATAVDYIPHTASPYSPPHTRYAAGDDTPAPVWLRPEALMQATAAPSRSPPQTLGGYATRSAPRGEYAGMGADSSLMSSAHRPSRRSVSPDAAGGREAWRPPFDLYSQPGKEGRGSRSPARRSVSPAPVARVAGGYEYTGAGSYTTPTPRDHTQMLHDVHCMRRYIASLERHSPPRGGVGPSVERELSSMTSRLNALERSAPFGGGARHVRGAAASIPRSGDAPYTPLRQCMTNTSPRLLREERRGNHA